MKILKGIGFGLIIWAAFFGIVVGAALVQGTRFVFPFLALVALPVLALSFPEKTKRQESREFADWYVETHKDPRDRAA